MVTLKDVSQYTGFSVNTVSRALRDMSDISAPTKEKIREAAARLGYQKNMAASMLKTRRSGTIGVVVVDLGNPLFASMVKGIEQVCKKEGYTVMLANSDESAEEELRAVNKMYEYGVEGIILNPSMENDHVIRFMQDREIPYIILGRQFPRVRENSVLNDDTYGGGLAAAHLASLGHRSFLYLTPPMHISSALERARGFRQALSERGFDPGNLRIVEYGTSQEASRRKARELFAAGFGATAIFCFSDYAALGVYAAANEAGIRIPGDLSVIGYDDIDFAAAMSPGLTTIDMGKYQLGVTAGTQLLSRIRSASVPVLREVVIRPRLIVRASTAPPHCSI